MTQRGKGPQQDGHRLERTSQPISGELLDSQDKDRQSNSLWENLPLLVLAPFMALPATIQWTLVTAAGQAEEITASTELLTFPSLRRDCLLIQGLFELLHLAVDDCNLLANA